MKYCETHKYHYPDEDRCVDCMAEETWNDYLRDCKRRKER